MSDIELHATAVTELEAYMRQAEMLAASTLVPANYRNKPADILVASLAGREVGMGPWASLTYVIVINGKATINAEGRVALIRKAGHSISGEAAPERAVAHGKRRDTGDEMTVEWTIQMAQRAGLVRNNTPWTQYPEAMLWARAVSQLSRMLFADVLMGVSYDPEELGATVDRDGAVIDVPSIAVSGDVDGMHPRDVVAALRERGLPCAGKPEELRERLAEALANEAAEDVPATRTGLPAQDAGGVDNAPRAGAAIPPATITQPVVERLRVRLDALTDVQRAAVEGVITATWGSLELVPEVEEPDVSRLLDDAEKAADKPGAKLAARAASHAKSSAA